MMELSNRVANYMQSLGIKKGDKVMLILKRHFQFWPTMLACQKLGAIAIPATSQLKSHDLTYRFKAGDVKAIFCTGDGDVAIEADAAEKEIGAKLVKVLVYGKRDGWHDYNAEVPGFPDVFERTADSPRGNDPMLMFFTSGTTGYPKMALHSCKYALGHYVTAKYWHLVERDGLHFTISETGWGKALWGKFYGQWLCEGAVFTYDFERFDAEKVLPMFEKYNITTFCAPPTIYRMLIKQDISKYDFTSVRHATTAGEALNPEVWTQFERATGLQIAEGFGQTETTLSLAPDSRGLRPDRDDAFACEPPWRRAGAGVDGQARSRLRRRSRGHGRQPSARRRERRDRHQDRPQEPASRHLPRLLQG